MATCTGAWRWYRPRVCLTARSSEKDVGSFRMISCLALPAWHSPDTAHDTVIAVTPVHLSVSLLTNVYAVHEGVVQQACMLSWAHDLSPSTSWRESLRGKRHSISSIKPALLRYRNTKVMMALNQVVRAASRTVSCGSQS